MLKKSMVIIGGSGDLGRAILSLLQKTHWKTLNIDYTETKLATQNHLLNAETPISSQLENVHKTVAGFREEYEAMISVAGCEPSGHSIKDPSVFSAYRRMYQANVESALLCTITLMHE